MQRETILELDFDTATEPELTLNNFQVYEKELKGHLAKEAEF